MSRLYQVFAFVCGSPHVWAPGGQPLPFCQRCTGLYVGCVVALVTYAWLRPRPTRVVLWSHFGLLLLMLPFGYHWVPQDATIRTATGFLFAFGLVYYLLLAPTVRFSVERPHAPALGWLLPAVGLVVVFGAARSDSTAVATALSWTGFVGLVIYLVLLVASTFVVPLSLYSALHRSEPR